MIRSIELNDVAAVRAIYNPYVEGTTITFEESPVTPEIPTDRIKEVTKAHPWLVDVDRGILRGYAYASQWRSRSAYRYTVETTIYIDPSYQRKGIGVLLYSELLGRLRELDLHVALGCIALPNKASVGLHEKLGFRKVAHFPEVGWKFGKWIDVGYWQLDLKRFP